MPIIRENHFVYMLVALIIFLVVLPIVEEFHLMNEEWTRSIAFSCLLAIGVWSLRGSRRMFVIGLALVVAGIVSNVLAVSNVEGTFIYASLVSLFLFLVLAIWAALKQVGWTSEINGNRIVGAICIYLLLGTIWAVAYTIVELAAPGSFNGIELMDEAGWDSRWIYFSFITLTTLGYGDITPATSTARVLAYSEAIFGVFYMAVLVAGLVSAYMAERMKS